MLATANAADLDSPRSTTGAPEFGAPRSPSPATSAQNGAPEQHHLEPDTRPPIGASAPSDAQSATYRSTDLAPHGSVPPTQQASVARSRQSGRVSSDGDGTDSGASAAEVECEAAMSAYGPDAELVAAFASGGRYRVICWIDTPIAKSPPPGPGRKTRRSFDRAVVGIRADDGAVELIKAGYRDLLPVEAP
jgi:hypothetical protein